MLGSGLLEEEPFELGDRESWEGHSGEVNRQGLGTLLAQEERAPGAKMKAVNMREVDRLDHEKKVNWARHMALLSNGSIDPRTEEGGPGA